MNNSCKKNPIFFYFIPKSIAFAFMFCSFYICTYMIKFTLFMLTMNNDQYLTMSSFLNENWRGMLDVRKTGLEITWRNVEATAFP